MIQSIQEAVPAASIAAAEGWQPNYEQDRPVHGGYGHGHGHGYHHGFHHGFHGHHYPYHHHYHYPYGYVGGYYSYPVYTGYPVVYNPQYPWVY
ncbi:hypothetical protein ACFFK0_23265 [Paenibacillus chartarius]|uniref:Cobalt transporter n=1 Tax=Paenibacillus chartarius TaxID=747481 RepID=A0ABV6DRP1_9BACL